MSVKAQVLCVSSHHSKSIRPIKTRSGESYMKNEKAHKIKCEIFTHTSTTAH